MSRTFTRRNFVMLAGSAVVATPGLLRDPRAWAYKMGLGDPTPSTARINELAWLSLSDAAAKLRTRQVSSVELTAACLERIRALGPKLNPFITVTNDAALAAAKQADEEIRAGRYRGSLHGIPYAAKDNIDTAGVRSTSGSAVFEDKVPVEDAPVIHRLKTAGAVLIGKANLQEFAMGASNTSYWGPVHNPWNLERYSGGSSSGSGAAVAGGLCFAALGTDTGGSVRIPAAYSGVVGLKPTYGLVPIRGIVPGILSLDVCGPITRNVEDAAMMLNVLAGYDRLDIASVEHPKEDYVAGMLQPVKDLRVGMPVGHFDTLEPDVEAAVREAIALLGGMTRGVKDVSLPPLGNAANVGAELFAWQEPYFKTQPGKYMANVRRSLEHASAANTRAVDYIHAVWALQELRRRIDDSFRDVDLVVLPTTRVVAPTIEELLKRDSDTNPRDPLNDYPDCVFFNVYGIPAISVPCGFSKGGLPIGLTIAGPHFSESRVFALAHAYEQATHWHLQRPPLFAETAGYFGPHGSSAEGP
jgi:aspartyl-tRNA(Asn)/glutamyl-tRNA(Gln) amidotransferase subunit A